MLGANSFCPTLPHPWKSAAFGSLNKPLNKCPVGPWATPCSFHSGRSVSFFPKNPTLSFPVLLLVTHSSCFLQPPAGVRALGWRSGSETRLQHSLAIVRLLILCSLGAQFLHLQNRKSLPGLPCRAVDRIRRHYCHVPFQKPEVVGIW